MPEPTNEAHIKYSGDIKGLEIEEPLDIHQINESIPNIIIETDNSKLSINITLSNIFSEDEARSIAEENVTLIVNRLIFEFDCSIENLQLRSLSLPPSENGTLNITVLNHIKAYACGTLGPIKPGKKEIQEVADKLKQPKSDTDSLLNQYRIAVSQKDA